MFVDVSKRLQHRSRRISEQKKVKRVTAASSSFSSVRSAGCGRHNKSQVNKTIMVHYPQRRITLTACVLLGLGFALLRLPLDQKTYAQESPKRLRGGSKAGGGKGGGGKGASSGARRKGGMVRLSEVKQVSANHDQTLVMKQVRILCDSFVTAADCCEYIYMLPSCRVARKEAAETRAQHARVPAVVVRT